MRALSPKPSLQALARIAALAALAAAVGCAEPQAMEARGAWLRARVAEPPPAGTDVLLVTHYPNMTAAFGEDAAGLGDGEALVFRPDGAGGAALVARIRIKEWPALEGAR